MKAIAESDKSLHRPSLTKVPKWKTLPLISLETSDLGTQVVFDKGDQQASTYKPRCAVLLLGVLIPLLIRPLNMDQSSWWSGLSHRFRPAPRTHNTHRVKNKAMSNLAFKIDLASLKAQGLVLEYP